MFDLLIIGAGPAGISVPPLGKAQKLGLKYLVIEKGHNRKYDFITNSSRVGFSLAGLSVFSSNSNSLTVEKTDKPIG